MNSRRIYDAQPVDPAAMTGSIEETIPDDGPLISADALHSAISRDFQKIPMWHTVLLSLLHEFGFNEVIRIVRSAEKVIGCSLPPLQDLYVSRIRANPSHPGHGLFVPLPSGRRLRSIQTRTSCHRNSFFPLAVRLILVVFVVLAVVLAAMCLLKLGNADECAKILGGMSGTDAIAFGKACLWVVVQLYTEYSHRHHSNARKRGYLRFYRQTKSLKNLPITVHSAGTVAFLVVQAVGLSPAVATYLLIGILALELILVVPFLIYHLATVWKHNSRRPAPDVCEDEHSQNVPGRTTETGFREGSNLEEVVEKQSDLIEYLMEHNRALSTRLLNLTVQH